LSSPLMSSHSFPDPIFESLLEKLVYTLEVAQRPDSTLNPQARQTLFQATSEFKDSLAKAKDLANSLPGGELLIEEQNDVITMLEELRDLKRSQLAQFSSTALSASSANVENSIKMEIDSTASSPHE